MADKHIAGASKLLTKKALSRGQRKRLQKKDKFVTSKLIEAQGAKTAKSHQDLMQSLKKQKTKKPDSGMECDDEVPQ